MFGLGKKIEACDDRERIEIVIPSWKNVLGGAKLYMREMDGDAMAAWAKRVSGIEKLQSHHYIEAIPDVMLRCIVNEENHRVFTDKDAEWIMSKGARALTAIAEAFLEANYMTKESQERAAKNLTVTPAV